MLYSETNNKNVQQLRFNNISCTSKVITILFFHTFHPLYTIQDLPYTNMENVALVGQKHAE